MRTVTLALFCVAVAPALNVHAFTREEILLYVPFDHTLAPTVIQGKIPPQIKGSFAFVPGKVGTAVTVGRKGTLLRYPAAGNMRPDQGTFSIWVQSVDWTLDEKVNRWWVDVPGPTRFIIYHYLHSSTVFFYHMDARRRNPNIIKARTRWAPGQWKHLAGTWKNGRLRFYVDGEKVPQEAQVQLGALGKWIVIGAPGKGTADTNLDEFYVFSRALEDIEIKTLYLRGVRKSTARIDLPKLGPAPRLDGAVSPGEYGMAAAVTGFCNRVTGLLDREQPVVYLGWDAANLYLAHVWPVPEKVRLQPDNYSFGPVRKEVRTRDGNLEEDDTVGLDLEGADGRTRRIRINALGTVSDSMDGDRKWDCSVRAAVQLDARTWTTEMAVPLADLGLAPGGVSGRLRLFRTHRLLRHDMVSWPGPNPGDAAEFVLSADAPALQLTSLGQLWDGRLDLQIVRRAGPDVKVRFSTDSGEIDSTVALAAASPAVRVERLLADTNLTLLKIAALCGTTPVLRLDLPVSYPPMFDADMFFFPSTASVAVRVLSRGPAQRAGATVRIVRTDGGLTDRSASTPGGMNDVRVVKLSTRDLPPGQYRVELTLEHNKNVLGRKSLPLTIKPTPEWLGNRLGIIDYVPKPWTPLEYGATSVSCWGRRVDLGAGLFPRQTVSQGAPLLAGPVQLVAQFGETEQRPGEVRFEWLRQTQQKGEWRTAGRLGPLSVRVNGSIEFDGMMWFEVTVTAPTAVETRRLRVEIPMAKAHSTLFYSGNYRAVDTGRTPTRPWSCAFRPCLGLSDEDRGLQWFAESTRGWHLKNKDKAIELLPTPEATVLVLNIADTPTEIGPQTRVFRFGLHPTPVKPPLQGRRLIRPFGKPDLKPKSNLRLWWTNYGLGCSYPLPVKQDARRWVEQQHADGVRVLAYTRLCECSVKGPWYEYFRDEWRVDPGPRMAYNSDADWGDANPVCPGATSWRDWTLWSIKKACEKLDFDGVYYDVSRPPSCSNRVHGCGFLDEDGRWQPEYQLLATRELQKRLWIMLHEQMGGKLVSHHMSGNLYTVTQAFDDLIIDGENYTSMLKDTYYDLLPLDTFRAEYMGRQWGLTSIFLPEFSRAQLTPKAKKLWESPAKLPAVRHLAGMIFLHDSLPWPAFSDLSPYYTIWAAQDALGWGDDVDFIPYWENAAVLDPLPADIAASVYRRDGRALLVLFNNTNAEVRVPLRLHPDQLGAPVSRLKDFESGKTFPVADGAAVVPVRKRDFRLLFTE
ncbi:MAG: hypothetical protein GXP31_04225 [Kiritimatiellaeota bacterium]|nr:hypothetical protein [Kiritimatiellota bacterium]